MVVPADSLTVFRAQLPVWSPVSGRGLVAGLRASLRQDVRDSLIESLREEYGARRIVLCDSGTSALTLALRALGPRPVVALPAYGCFDLATAVVGANASVRFYDLDPRTLTPDERSLRRALAEGVSAVVLAHFYGVPVDVAAWVPEIHAAGAVAIDDAAQGIGAVFDGRPSGSGGDIGVLSFGRGKGRTGGHGGAVLAMSDQGLDLAAHFSVQLPAYGALAEVTSFGKLVAQWMLGRPAWYGIPQRMPGTTLGETIYHPPRSVRALGRTAAGIVLAGTEVSHHEVSARRALADVIRERIAPLEDANMIQVHPKAAPGWLRFPVVLSDRRVAVARSRVGRAVGMMGGYPAALPDLAELDGRMLGTHLGWPGAAELVRGLVTLPTHRWVDSDDLDRMVMILEGSAADA